MEHVVSFNSLSDGGSVNDIYGLIRKSNTQEFGFNFNGCVAEMMFIGANIGAWAFNIKTKELFFTEHYPKSLGYVNEQLRDINFLKERINKEHLISMIKSYLKHANDEINIWEGYFKIKNNNEDWVESFLRGRIVSRDCNGDPLWMFGVVFVEDLEKHNEDLIRQAKYDALTNLPNRRFLIEKLNEEIARSNRNKNNIAICFIDLNKFKPINDNYGHLVGDELLVKFSKSIQEAVRDTDFVARIGGDEFVAILTDVEEGQVLNNAIKRIFDACNERFMLNYGKLVIKTSASIGVVVYPMVNVDAESLIMLADKAMYSEKMSKKENSVMINLDISGKNFKEISLGYDFSD